MCKDIYSSLGGVYDSLSPYKLIADDIVEAYQKAEKMYDNFASRVHEIDRVAGKWESLYTEVKLSIDKRNEFRREYDHYVDKFEKLLVIRKEKLDKKIVETDEEVAMNDRVMITYNNIERT